MFAGGVVGHGVVDAGDMLDIKEGGVGGVEADGECAEDACGEGGC